MATDFNAAKDRIILPFRADHVGSFLHPEAMKDARAKIQLDE